jgi:putative restriction endonuclease
MSYTGLTYAELDLRFRELRQATVGGHRAPHKPLLVLLMLGRYQRSEFEPLKFSDAQNQLAKLLCEFGPPSRTANVLDPFWRLQNDGIWRVMDEANGRIAETTDPPNAAILADRRAKGNFISDITETLKQNPN